jgi:hypothetical protein
MEKVIVGAPRLAGDAGMTVLSSRISIAGQRREVFFRSSHGPLTTSADPFLALALLPAMKLGAPLHIEGDVSPRLLRRTAQVQDIINAWYPEFRKTQITVHGWSAAQPASPGAA